MVPMALPPRLASTASVAKPASKVAIGAAATFYGLLMTEVAVARRRIGTTDAVPPSADGVYGDDLPGESLRLLILGDSTSVGYGMEHADQTPAALAGLGLAHVLDRPIDVRSFAVVGARSSHLIDQIAKATATNDVWEQRGPDLAMILIGANDVTHSVPRALAARQLARAVRELRAQGAEVVVGTCPDLGTVKPLPQPLRAMARRRSRQLAKAQAVAALEAGARTVSLADLLGDLFVTMADQLFGSDNFHPSATGYAHLMSFLVASGAAAWRERDEIETAARGTDMSIDEAVTDAVEHAGTELVPTRGGRWARVRRRVR